MSECTVDCEDAYALTLRCISFCSSKVVDNIIFIAFYGRGIDTSLVSFNNRFENVGGCVGLGCVELGCVD